MKNAFQKLKNTVQFHYYRKKNGWEFPSDMAHTSGARVAGGTYEPDLTGVIRESVHKGATVIDIGANVGYYTRLFAERVGQTGQVFAFEIESENYRCLCKNIAELDQVTPLAMAVSNRNGVTRIRRSSHSSCHSMLDTGNYQSKSCFRVASISLDTFWEMYLDRGRIDCVKIDVEGAEALVLEGMQQVLEQDAVRYLIVELCPQIMINAGFEPVELFEQLTARFRVNVVEAEYRDAVGDGVVGGTEQFNRLCDHLLNKGDFINCNLFCDGNGLRNA